MSNVLNEKAKLLLRECLFGTGNLEQFFNIEPEMDRLKLLVSNMD